MTQVLSLYTGSTLILNMLTGDARVRSAGWSPQIGGIVLGEAGDIRLQVQALPGRTYRIEFKDDLNAVAWTGEPVVHVAHGPMLEVVEPLEAVPQRYYRVVLLP